MLWAAPEIQRRFFRQKSDPDMRFGCITQKLMNYSGLSLSGLLQGKSCYESWTLHGEFKMPDDFDINNGASLIKASTRVDRLSLA
jgi:hypothetical protein